MTIATLDELGLELNDDGIVEGIQFGKARRIQEWKDKQEEKKYAKLFKQLEARNAARKASESDVGRQRLRANQERYKTANRDRMRANERLRRKKAYDADPVVNVCTECGKAWKPEYEKRNKKSKFCSRSCRNRNHGRSRERPTIGIRKMDLETECIRFVSRNPGLTSASIALAIDAKPNSLKVCLKRWADQGKLERCKVGREFVYSVP
jgi:hypothetical protein